MYESSRKIMDRNSNIILTYSHLNSQIAQHYASILRTIIHIKTFVSNRNSYIGKGELKIFLMGEI